MAVNKVSSPFGNDDFPPRGSGIPGAKENTQRRTWGHPRSLMQSWDWSPGKIILGEWEGRLLGDPDRSKMPLGSGDDRHVVTVAGSRAGKSSTVLIPNLLHYPGSVIVIDPKGELARATANHRMKAFGQDVTVLDPFGTSGIHPASYNPLDELNPADETFVDDVGLVADALIIDATKDIHWTDTAKNLIRGIILYMAASGGEFSLVRLRRILLGDEGSLTIPTGNPIILEHYLFMRMRAREEFDGLISFIGSNFLQKSEKELGSVLSTAREQLVFLDSKPLAPTLKSSSVRLSALKRHPMTVYLCLPALRLATHSRWLRLIISLGFSELEREATKPQYPVLFMLEEFGALGYLRSIERSAGFMAGFGVRLWSVLQDFTQLKQAYPQSWETFLGNAGIIQAFGNIDITTTEYLSKMLGETQVMETHDIQVSSSATAKGDLGRREHPRNVPLLGPSEIAQYFSRETGRQLIVVPGRPPIYMMRLPHG